MQTREESILLVLEDQQQGEVLAQKLYEDIGVPVIQEISPDAALKKTQYTEIRVLITDIFLPNKLGLKLIKNITSWHPDVIPVIAVPEGNRRLTVEALKEGAFFCINSPLDIEEAYIIAYRSLTLNSHMRLQRHNDPHLRKNDGFFGMVGNTSKMKELFELISRIGKDDQSTVLIQGESGSGKELVAKALHKFGPRKNQNYQRIGS